MGLGDFFTSTKSITEQEKTAVLARYARGNFAGASNHHINERKDADFQLAVTRLQKKVGSEEDATHVVGLILTLIQDGDITINFNASKWFATENLSTNYTQMYEDLAAGRPANRLNPPQNRETAENRVFDFKAGPPKARSLPQQNFDAINAGIRTYGASDGYQQNGAGQWGATSTTFVPMMRPRYAAVNFGRWPNGAAPGYGYSFFVLKPYLRFNATFSHCDTFSENAKKDNLCGFHNLSGLIAHADDELLEAFIRCATEPGATYNSFTRGSDGMQIVEAQIHADVFFDRDIARMVVATREVQMGSPVSDNVMKFGARNSIPKVAFV